jgi:hypothetical protein
VDYHALVRLQGFLRASPSLLSPHPTRYLVNPSYVILHTVFSKVDMHTYNYTPYMRSSMSPRSECSACDRES